MSFDIGLKVPSERLPELHFVAAIQDTLSTIDLLIKQDTLSKCVNEG